MISLSRRQRWLGGALGIVVVAWAIDMLTGGQDPPMASAASAPASQLNAVSVPLDQAEVEAVIGMLSTDDVVRPPLSCDGVARDLFVPTAQMRAALATILPDSPSESACDDTENAQSFEARHCLQGVLMGRVPLALIDGRLYRGGAEIDGYRLVQLERDHAVFDHQGARVTLRVAPPDGGPQNRPD